MMLIKTNSLRIYSGRLGRGAVGGTLEEKYVHLRRLRINNSRALEDIDVSFDSRVSVIFGPNAIGKTIVPHLSSSWLSFLSSDILPCNERSCHLSRCLKKRGQLFTVDYRPTYKSFNSGITPMRVLLFLCLLLSMIKTADAVDAGKEVTKVEKSGDWQVIEVAGNSGLLYRIASTSINNRTHNIVFDFGTLEGCHPTAGTLIEDLKFYRSSLDGGILIMAYKVPSEEGS
jgi:hypothetical protein